MWVDSHCHLNFPELKPNLPEIMDACKVAGVSYLLTINTHLTQTEEIIDIASQYANVFCTAGVHPHDAKDYGDQDSLLAELCQFAKNPKVVGFGETGLDYHYNNSPREQQQQSFRTHIEAALSENLPIIVHTREAEEDTVNILKDYPGLTGVMHCFSGTQWLAEQAIALGFYISFSGVISFKKAELLRQTAKWVPANRILVETDAPFLAPEPYRGKSNQPAWVSRVGEILADVRGTEPSQLAQITTDNFFNLFQRAAACR